MCPPLHVSDPLTFEWTDGLIASATRKFAKDSASQSDEHSRPGSEASKVIIFSIKSANWNTNSNFILASI